MKDWLLIYICSILFGLFSFGCNGQQKGSINNETDSTFVLFLGKIEDIRLPFTLEMGSEDTKEYIETSYGNGRYNPNERFRTINKQDSKFLREKYSVNDNLLYKALFKRNIGIHNLVLITQNDLSSLEFYLFKLNSYSLSGKLIDTLTVAGALPFGIEMGCVIDEKLLITTKADIPVPEAFDKTDSIPALFIYSTYKLTDEGFFKKVESKRTEGFYYLMDNNSQYEFRPK